MNNIKNQFSIIDFENLSGIKAHTIRIWEKRYQLFKPTRHGNNERLYDLEDLRKMLNISFLQNNGWKISKIAALSKDEIAVKINELVAEKGKYHEAINQFKVAMLTFDQDLFNQTYQKLMTQWAFREVFNEIFIPLLDLIGMLWQTGTIIPAHEHFISQLIENKLHINIEKIQNPPNRNDRTFVLFLPENEVHNLGILYIQYELLLKGYHTIYLGPSIPVDNLKILQTLYHPLTFVTQFTVAPSVEVTEAYIQELETELLQATSDECWINGRKAHLIQEMVTSKRLKTFPTVKELLKSV
ncbi:MAG: MerR family transcriptional regulator [Flavobacteriaceae bacterium]|nr:MerR family transcriptional regulator [Flavobacteriaceae bacterium]